MPLHLSVSAAVHAGHAEQCGCQSVHAVHDVVHAFAHVSLCCCACCVAVQSVHAVHGLVRGRCYGKQLRFRVCCSGPYD